MMSILTFIGYIIAAFIIASFLVFLYVKWSYQYWNRKEVPFITPKFPYGNVRGPSNVREPEYMAIYRCYEELRAKGLKHGGIYSIVKPLYLPVDAEYIKNIIVTDFQHFYNRSTYYNEKHDPVSAHLLALEGQRWKNMRTKLTPAFTSSKMKTMMQLMVQCGNQMVEAVDKMITGSSNVDIREITARYTTDVIGTCAFGIECNCFRDPDPEFRKVLRKANFINTVRHLQRLMAASFPNFSRFIGIPSISKDISTFFLNMTRDNVKYRRQNNYKRNDILQILMDVHLEFEKSDGTNGLKGKELKDARKPLTIEEIAANFFLFFVGGFETSSITMSFTLYELSVNQDIQDKVRHEINAVLAKYDGEITYESLFEMKYIRQVFDEVLRMYPVIPLFKRKCTKDYKLPGTDVVLEQGTSVYVSVLGVQRNPDYFLEPDKFDPNRFSEENKGNIRTGSYMGFGDGPRSCIGKRFALMQITIALVILVKRYRIKLSPKTKRPLEFDPNTFILAPKGNIWITLEKL